jgi:hypothetical protein
MARRSKPWYREARGEWCVTIDKVHHRLGPDKKAAFERFHELMAGKPLRFSPTRRMPRSWLLPRCTLLRPALPSVTMAVALGSPWGFEWSGQNGGERG